MLSSAGRGAKDHPGCWAVAYVSKANRLPPKTRTQAQHNSSTHPATRQSSTTRRNPVFRPIQPRRPIRLGRHPIAPERLPAARKTGLANVLAANLAPPRRSSQQMQGKARQVAPHVGPAPHRTKENARVAKEKARACPVLCPGVNPGQYRTPMGEIGVWGWVDTPSQKYVGFLRFTTLSNSTGLLQRQVMRNTPASGC